MAERVRVVVCYAGAQGVWQCELLLEPGTTLLEAVMRSGLFEAHPATQSASIDYGVWGKRRRGDEFVRDGDRIEVYRPLTFDPMESRRRRAAKRRG